MKKELIISDTGPLISLALLGSLNLLTKLFDQVIIPKAVWEELTSKEEVDNIQELKEFFENKVVEIHGFNDLSFVMDLGESEALILYKQLNADYLLIDDKKARNIAENFSVKCVGTIGLLVSAKENGFIDLLNPLFEKLTGSNRYYSIKLLNSVLLKYGETSL